MRFGKIGGNICAVLALLMIVGERPVLAMADQAPTDARPLHQDQPPLSDHVIAMIEDQGGAALPILVPAAMTVDGETADHYEFRLKVTARGYTALLSDQGMDIVIVGISPRLAGLRSLFSPATNRFDSETNNNAFYFGSESILENLDYLRDFESLSEGPGGSISFGFADCDYHVEFYCPASDSANRQACITGSEAKTFVLDLFAE